MKTGRIKTTPLGVVIAIILAMGAATTTGVTTAWAAGAAPETEIHELRARLEKLEAQHNETMRLADIKRTADQVLQDANQHSQLMEVGSFNAGYKNGKFFIGSEDGNFNLRPWAYFQFRNITNRRQGFKNGNDDTQNGFEMRRAKFGFEGNAFSPDLTYMFSYGTTRASGTANVTNAAGVKIGTVTNSLGGVPIADETWVKYRINHGDFYMKAGQIKGPIMHEQMVSSRTQLAAERSVAADVFVNGDTYLQAVDISYEPQTWIRLEGAITHGMRSLNTNFLDFPNSNAFNYGFEARADFKVMGQWADYQRQMGAFGVKEQLLAFGIGADYSERGHSNQIVAAVDVTYVHPKGLSLYGAFIDRYTNHNFGFYSPSTTSASITAPPASVLNHATNEYAIVAQAAYLLDGHIEPFARFEYLKLQGTATGSRNYLPVITTGANYYLNGHNIKLTAQVLYLPSGIPVDDASNDILASPAGRGELVGTMQLQFGF